MKLIEILEERVSKENDHKEVCSWLYNMALTIIKEASAHLEYVRNTLVEFDKHNAHHSEKVLDIIEKLLGNRAKKLSSYDLFSLIAVSYLHDCGMAVSDYEINVMNLVENDEYDGKKVLETKEVFQLIEGKKDVIFKSDKSKADVTNWLFYPGDANKLFEYYSILLRDYQTFRNGKIDVIRKSKDLKETNYNLRTDYIRLTHAGRAEIYVKTWRETKFTTFPNKAMGKRLAENIALACKAHGEDSDYVRKLGKKVMYSGGETSNLQFVAMMLRIGDIVHYSYDRAPSVLRALHDFDSDYSFEQWRMKSDSGVDYSISTDGEISFSAYCSIPKDYYNLQKYIDWIDKELILYKRIRNKGQWDDSYLDLAKIKVNRDNIEHDASFTPVPDLRFTLNQKRIIELLMGVGLYKDKYACIRELYQNSLDACRCQVSKDEALGKTTNGIIEFGVDKEAGETYLYCLDNGKGMSKMIIENYLLKVGDSYYKSPEFYQEQAKTGFKFTPTSQFGIGILSCFMIGHKIEIVTKEDNGELNSCVINGPLEYFYYKTPSEEDKELIPSSGTLVKVFLKKEIIDELNCSEIENRGFLALLDKKVPDDITQNLQTKLSKWKTNLYGIVDTFVVIIPEKVALYIKWDNGKKERVFSKPIMSNINNLSSEEINQLDKITSHYHTFISVKDNINFVDSYILEDTDENELVQYRTMMVLPKPGVEQHWWVGMNRLIINSDEVCVDGISISGGDNWDSDFYKRVNGIINFYGEHRPQISVDRTRIVNGITKEYDEALKIAVKRVIAKAIEMANMHIQNNKIQQASEIYNMVWQSVFSQFHSVSSFIMETFAKLPSDDMKWNNLSSFLVGDNKNLKIGEFMKCSDIKMPNYDYNKMDKISRIVILNKFLQVEDIKINGNEVVFSGNRQLKDIVLDCNGKSFNSFVCTSNYGNIFDHYDIITSLYPMVPDYIYNLIKNEPVELIEKHFLNNVITSRFGFKALFRSYYPERLFHLTTNIGLKLPTMYKDEENYKLAITAFISPKEYSQEEIEDIENKFKITFDSKVEKEGYSLIWMDKSYYYDNTHCFYKAGKCSRKELVQLIPDSFWEKHSDYEYVFPNGELVKDYLD